MKARHELVYFLTEDTACRMSSFISEYLDLGEYSTVSPNVQYHLYTLYLDSDDWKIYWSAVNGDNLHARLRVRYYDHPKDQPVLFEVKHQKQEVTIRNRFAVHAHAVPVILAGSLPSFEHFTHFSPAQFGHSQEFIELMERLCAHPKFRVCFSRETWGNHDNEARITFDRNIRLQPGSDAELRTDMLNALCPFKPFVIMKLKFAERFPNWYHTMVETFGCSQFELPACNAEDIIIDSTRLNPADLLKCIL